VEVSVVSDSPQVIVVGAGIAGLACAFRVQRAGYAVRVLERNGPQFVGGRMATVDRAGYPIDRGGNLLMSRYTHLIKLIMDAGLHGEMIPARDEIGILRERGVRRMRTSSVRGLIPGVKGYSFRDMVRLLADYRRIRPEIDWCDLSGMATHDFESVQGYASRRGLRPDTLEYLLEPMSGGMSLGEPEETSMIAAFMFFDIVVRGAGFFTSEQGVSFVPRGLARGLAVEYDARVVAVEERAGEVAVTWTRPGEPEHQDTAAACAVAVPVPNLLEICSQFTPDQREYLTAVRYTSDIHVDFGLDRPTEETASLLLVPRREQPDIMAYSLLHNQSPRRVPGGRGYVRADFRDGFARQHWEMSDSRLTDQVLASTHSLGILPELERHTMSTSVDRIEHALVLRRPGDYRAVARFAATLRKDARVQLAGADYLAHSSTNGSAAAGERTARAIVEILTQERSG